MKEKIKEMLNRANLDRIYAEAKYDALCEVVGLLSDEEEKVDEIGEDTVAPTYTEVVGDTI
jgi:hypothetical protein